VLLTSSLGVTAISIAWMSSLGQWLCKDLENVLADPPPRYDAKKDRIRVPVQPYFMHIDWKLPLMMVDMQGIDVFKYFARFFLEGLVRHFPKGCLRQILRFLLCSFGAGLP